MCGLPFVPFPWGLQMLGQALEMAGSLGLLATIFHSKGEGSLPENAANSEKSRAKK